MSKEFEKIVLKKLDALDERTKNIEKQINSHKEEFNLIHKELKSHQEEFSSIHQELNATQESIKKLNDDFTVFDFEINKKIDTLFDAITVNNEKHDLFEKSIISLNTKTFNHDIRLSVLEDYNKNSKIFATS